MVCRISETSRMRHGAWCRKHGRVCVTSSLAGTFKNVFFVDRTGGPSQLFGVQMRVPRSLLPPRDSVRAHGSFRAR
eukprot:scaffold152028_cov24-Tisochrysis_lutea.AAC.1